MIAAPLTLPPLPRERGAYRWFYTDVHGDDWTAVVIFMVGAVFSPRYAARRTATPVEHCAVNLALYARGRRRAWVFSEYAGAAIEAGLLRIGSSTLAYAPDGSVRLHVCDRTAPWGRTIEAEVTLAPRCAPGPVVPIVDGLPHHWQALAPRAEARLVVPSLDVAIDGVGYHDTNAGDEPLGLRLPGWRWGRIHGTARSLVCLEPPPPARAIHATVGPDGVRILRGPAIPTSWRRTGWGLPVPARISAGGLSVPSTHLLESSPFYARQEGEADGAHALAEVADFRRFRSPLIRWMAHFRMRTGRAA